MGEIINFYDLIPEGEKITYLNPNYNKCLISHPSKILISGKSGNDNLNPGKTNLLLNIITRMRCFEKYYLFIKMLDSDPLYRDILIPILQNDERRSGSQILMITSNTLDDLPDVNDETIDATLQNIFIFDDLAQETTKCLKKITQYFTKMRKKNCTLVFITQNYFEAPITLRRQIDIFFFTNIVSENEKASIHKDLIASDLSKEKFLQMLSQATQNGGHLIIDRHKKTIPLKYRSNFTKVWDG